MLSWLFALSLAVIAHWVTTAANAAEGDFQPIPKLEKRVTDLTATLSNQDEARITSRIKAFEQKKGGQIAVLIVGTTQPEVIFDYSMRVSDAWKLGRKGVDDGVLFVIAKNDRKMQILTATGINGVLTDAMSKRIITEIVSPRFREGKFADGIYDGVDKMASVMDGEALPPPPQKKVATSSTQSGGGLHFIFVALAAVFFIGPLLRKLLGRFLGATAAGGVYGLAAWWIFGAIGIAAFAAIGTFVMVLVMGTGLGNALMRGGGYSGGGWSGGGGGSSGGGSSDSFSGGGGSSDGGGASGDW